MLGEFYQNLYAFSTKQIPALDPENNYSNPNYQTTMSLFSFTFINSNEENPGKSACLLNDSGRARFWPAEGSLKKPY